MSLALRKSLVTLLTFLMLFIPVFSQAQQPSDFLQGKMDGERDAKGNFLWFIAGVGCGIFGIGAAYIVKPEPSATALVGKSSDYVLGYTEGYKEEGRSKNTTYAAVGCLTWSVIYLATAPKK